MIHDLLYEYSTGCKAHQRVCYCKWLLESVAERLIDQVQHFLATWTFTTASIGPQKTFIVTNLAHLPTLACAPMEFFSYFCSLNKPRKLKLNYTFEHYQLLKKYKLKKMIQNTKFGDVGVFPGHISHTAYTLTHCYACTDGNKHSSRNGGHSKNVCSWHPTETCPVCLERGG